MGVGGRWARARLMSAAVAALACVSLIGAPPASAAAKCSDIELIFARGTDEPPGIGAVGSALVEALRPMVKGRSINTYAVKYPASWDFLEVATGATDASRRVQYTAVTCPKTDIVLGGYSQGAAAIDVVATAPIAGLGYAAPLPAAAVPHIKALTVFGNPGARIGQPLTRMSPVFGPRTADLCNTNDPVCSLGRDFDAHVRYPQSGLVKLGARWIAALVTKPSDSA